MMHMVMTKKNVKQSPFRIFEEFRLWKFENCGLDGKISAVAAATLESTGRAKLEDTKVIIDG